MNLLKMTKLRAGFRLISPGKNSIEKQIYLVCTHKGTEIFYYSGYRVDENNFINKKVKEDGTTISIQQVKAGTINSFGINASRINKRLRELTAAAYSVFDREFSGSNLKLFSKESFKHSLQEELGELPVKPVEQPERAFFELYEDYMQSTNVCEARRRHIKSDIKRLKEYSETLKYDLNEKTININHYKLYIKRSMSDNSAIGVLKRLRAFFNHAKGKLNIFESSPFDNISFSEDIGVEIYHEPVCMTREELTILAEKEMPDKESEIIRDMFCLQAALGCRVGDFLRLTSDNIINGRLEYFPHKTATKQMNKVVVPISKRAESIMKKYKSKSKSLMPFVNASDYNEGLKFVFRVAKLERKVIIYNREKGKEEYFKLYELASSHLARRTFVDILCQAGEPIHVVASMSGHSERSKAFDRYRSRPEQLQKNAVSRSMD